MFYHLSHQGSPKILEWVAYPFSREIPERRIEHGSPELQADCLPAKRSLPAKDPLPAELPGKPFKTTNKYINKGFPGSSVVKDLPANAVPSLGGEDPLEKEMATYSSIPAKIISWTKAPGGL